MNTCGQVFWTRPFSSQGELRNCTREAGHPGGCDAEKEIPRNPFARRRLGFTEDKVPTKVFR